MKIVADAHIPFVKEYFGASGELVLKPGRALTRADVKDADILLVRSITPVNQELLAGSRVKFVGSVTAGADHIDGEWLQKEGIAFSTAAGFNAPPVADYVVAVVAALQHKQLLAKERMKAAVIGVGHAGRLVAEKLALLNAEVILCDPLRAEKEKNFHSLSLDDLSDVDFISLHVPLTKSGPYPTHHFIDKAFLLRQKLGCVLLNASRGSVINAKDLLYYGTHLQWCLDVWAHEPNIDKTLLEKSLTATPHIAGYSVQSKMRGIAMIYQIACEKHFLPAQKSKPPLMPEQTLSFAGQGHHWQDIVLGVFNPLVVTAMMRSLLLPAENVGSLFDDLRNQFNYRQEFGFTKIVNVDVSEADRNILTQLGLTLVKEGQEHGH